MHVSLIGAQKGQEKSYIAVLVLVQVAHKTLIIIIIYKFNWITLQFLYFTSILQIID